MKMKKLIKFIYKAIPLKKQLFTILKWFWKPKQNIYKHLTFDDIFKIKISKNLYFKMNHFGFELENFLFWEGLYGTWEKESLKLWVALSKESKSIMDIGANTGVYALVSAKVNPSSSIHAFEPVDRVFNRLQHNIQINKIQNINSHKIGLSDKNGQATIYDSYEDHTYSVTINKNLWSKERKVKEVQIPIKKLDSFIYENDIPNIDLMKIDVETHEYELLLGMKNNLITMQPTMLIEILNDEIAANIETLLKGLNYLYFNIDEEKGVFKVEKLTKSNFHNFLICKENVAKSLKLI